MRVGWDRRQIDDRRGRLRQFPHRMQTKPGRATGRRQVCGHDLPKISMTYVSRVRSMQRLSSYPLSAYFSGPSRERAWPVGEQVTRPPCALLRRLRTYPQDARDVDHSLRLSVYRPDKGYRLPFACLGSGRAAATPISPGSESPPSPRIGSEPTRHRGAKKPERLLAGECRATAKRKLARSATRAGPSNFSRCASEQIGRCSQHVRPLDQRASVECGGTLCPSVPD